jgi:hypothetical protein
MSEPTDDGPVRSIVRGVVGIVAPDRSPQAEPPSASSTDPAVPLPAGQVGGGTGGKPLGGGQPEMSGPGAGAAPVVPGGQDFAAPAGDDRGGASSSVAADQPWLVWLALIGVALLLAVRGARRRRRRLVAAATRGVGLDPEVVALMARINRRVRGRLP